MALGMVDDPPPATHLISRNHGGEVTREWGQMDGSCYFCGHSGDGIQASDVISADYFSDHDLRARPDSDHVCSACAYCMSQRELKQGHWIASADSYHRVATGDLFEELGRIRDGEHEPPLAVHVSENPIRSEHAYLWTPVTHSTDPLVLTYGTQSVRLEWPVFDDVLDAIEELRRHGFRGDDIRSGEPRVADVASVGRDRYRTVDARIDPHRRTALFDVAWTASRSADDQPTPSTNQ